MSGRAFTDGLRVEDHHDAGAGEVSARLVARFRVVDPS
jgi:hypothetical protein